MAIQMFLIHPRDADDDHARESIAEFIVQRGGFVLMATSAGSLITAFDEIHLSSVKALSIVEFAGGVTLDPAAPGAAVLQRLFAENVAAQLAGRPSNSFPPGYRPLRWHNKPDEK
jgi:hypothetical protein